MENQSKLSSTHRWQRRLALVFAVGALVFASLACNLPAGDAGRPTDLPPMETLPPAEVQQGVQATLESSADGPVTLTLSEAEVNTLVADALAENPDAPIRDPRVVLRDGEMDLYGRVEQGLLSGDARLTISASVDSEGQPDLEIRSATLGAFPIPAGMLSSLSTLLDQTLTSSLGSAATRFKLESISIQPGQMTITGRPQ